ncbi:hypothetical protein ACOYW6_10380 [Parablastomonas sp. CN1-191]|uniref:hypothetical protein n=1 Tax=Parablastomonas sp. CN1-191 TaxID=3400908 RepID=UPI003BF7E7F0
MAAAGALARGVSREKPRTDDIGPQVVASQVVQTDLKALPAPTSAAAASPIGAFAAYALAQAALPEGTARDSVVIDPTSVMAGPRRLPCAAQPPAVVLDLDPATGTFDPNDAPTPAPGLIDALGKLRAAGLTVFWKSALPVARADAVYTVLRAVGLDPDRTDRLLLVRGGDDTKEARLVDAARDWCFVAAAGDRRGDFLEALDYLRNPADPIATTVEPLIGNGWFVTPTPID